MEEQGEVRKVQKTGGSTYIVSLPKHWVEENKIKPGDGLVVKRLEDSTLQIFPLRVKEEKKAAKAIIKISQSDDPYKLARKVVSLYLVGYQVIHLSSEGKITPQQREVIKIYVREKLVGAELIADSPGEMTIQILLSYPELSVKDALRRMFLIASSMQKDSISALEKLDRETAAEVIRLDNEVDRFSMYVIRQIKLAVQDPRSIREIGLRNARDCLGYRLIVKSVERIADHAALIAEKVLRINKPLEREVLKGILNMSSLANTMLEKSVLALFNEDYDLAEEIIVEKEKAKILEEKVAKLTLEIPREDLINVRLMLESLRRIAEYSSDIAEIVLNLTVTETLS
ncbi:MAG: PhoU domain-containing protein [Candidatus Hadarchaeum sp.]|uniref:PhoU domain-containing protein n=1 Tax=Candidatus Hadarchaeum sp. TaxID=2883567 RepID=UPI003D0DBE75